MSVLTFDLWGSLKEGREVLFIWPNQLHLSQFSAPDVFLMKLRFVNHFYGITKEPWRKQWVFMEAGSYKSIFGALEGQFATKGLYISQELIAVTVSKSKCRPEIGFPMVTSQDGRLCWGESTSIGLLVEVKTDAKHRMLLFLKMKRDTYGC